MDESWVAVIFDVYRKNLLSCFELVVTEVAVTVASYVIWLPNTFNGANGR